MTALSTLMGNTGKEKQEIKKENSEEEEEEEEKQVAEDKPEPDVIKKEDSEEESQRKQDISGEKGTDVTTGSAQPVAPTQNSVSSVGGSSTSNTAQTEEQPSSFFGSLFSILMKPFSLIASFFGGFSLVRP